MKYKTKDSGKRVIFKTGMNRDVDDEKPRYDLLIPLEMDNPLLKRWAELMARGAKKYSARNWEKACTEEELERFKASAFRHFIAWFQGDRSEDHGAATCFNIQGGDFVEEKLAKHKGKVVKYKE